MIQITLKPIHHPGDTRLGLYFTSDTRVQHTIKRIGAKWSNTQKCWWLPLDKENYNKLQKTLTGIAVLYTAPLKQFLENQKTASFKTATVKIALAAETEKKPITDISRIHQINGQVLAKMKQHLVLKAYSTSTIKTYLNELNAFLQTIRHHAAEDFTAQRLKDYLQYCATTLNLSENTLHSRMNALKFYYEQVLSREKFFWEIPRPKKQLLLPSFFNQDEVAAIIKATENLKHKAMLMLAYASGLRVSEVVAIKVKDIDSKRMCILIRQAKGKKDRMVSLSPVLLVMLRAYWKTVNLTREGFLFPGQNKNEPYSTRSLQLVIAGAKKKAGILKSGSIHALRHSFATHLLDKGTDVTMIMKLLGHNDIKTTLRYLHVTNRDMLQIMSPLDNLSL